MTKIGCRNLLFIQNRPIAHLNPVTDSYSIPITDPQPAQEALLLSTMDTLCSHTCNIYEEITYLITVCVSMDSS